MPQILIIPVIYNQKERLGIVGIAAGFYPRPIKQLLNIFRSIATTINLYDALMLDQGSTVNSHLFNKNRNQWNSENILESERFIFLNQSGAIITVIRI